MGNVNVVLSENILKYRKICGLSQRALAQKLGVTFQAVSKWETAKSAPDIAFLPTMAEIFECSIDDLFSYIPINNREAAVESTIASKRMLNSEEVEFTQLVAQNTLLTINLKVEK